MTLNNNKLSFDLLPQKNEPFAEIVESCLDNFVAQSWRWNFFPDFGSLLQVQNNDFVMFGCVIHVQTGSMDPLRYPFPYQKTEEELLAEQPQIFEFLKTIFKVQVLGYVERTSSQNKITYLVPPRPCKIHAFVSHAELQVASNFFEKTDFMNLLFAFSNQIPNLDELLLAILNRMAKQKILNQVFLNDFCQHFSLLTGNDYRRLKLFLQRVEMLV
jgi:hypothetical protein